MKIKKHLFVVSMLAVMMSLAGCVEEAKKGFDYDEAELTLNAMSLFEEYADVDEEYVGYYLKSGTDFEKSAVKGIDQARNNDKVGEFEDYKKYLLNYNAKTFNPEEVDAEFSEEEEAVTVTIINKAKERDVEISVKYTENPDYYIEYGRISQKITKETLTDEIVNSYNTTVEEFLAVQGYESLDALLDVVIASNLASAGIEKYIPEEMVVSAVYSMGEMMKQAGLNTLIGMGTVFVVLIFILFIISLFKYLPALTAKKAKMPEPKQEDKKHVDAPKPAAAPAPADENLMNDAELVAVITAAVYAASGSNVSLATSRDKLVVRSIKRVKR